MQTHIEQYNSPTCYAKIQICMLSILAAHLFMRRKHSRAHTEKYKSHKCRHTYALVMVLAIIQAHTCTHVPINHRTQGDISGVCLKEIAGMQLLDFA